MGKKFANLVVKVHQDSTVADLEAQVFDQLTDAGMPTNAAAPAAQHIATDAIARRDSIIQNGGTVEATAEYEDAEDTEDRLDVAMQTLETVTDTLLLVSKRQFTLLIAIAVIAGVITIPAFIMTVVFLRALLRP